MWSTRAWTGAGYTRESPHPMAENYRFLGRHCCSWLTLPAQFRWGILAVLAENQLSRGFSGIFYHQWSNAFHQRKSGPPERQRRNAGKTWCYAHSVYPYISNRRAARIMQFGEPRRPAVGRIANPSLRASYLLRPASRRLFLPLHGLPGHSTITVIIHI